MMYSIIFTNAFKKGYKKLPDAIKTKAKKTIEILSVDPSYPSLRTKNNYSWSKYLNSKVHECSINMNYRIIFTYEEDKIILLHAVGEHKIVDRN
ncbi:type II toxin-antitoxin system RelE/ParE family toxin [Brassicibacter mesophilus]|uniref:type II toxin-antitoxin system RelE/ParE family toxin n=1 Tax=Brassicibacter mesophilus TaxID=745119 RepID=UPI003D1EC9C7